MIPASPTDLATVHDLLERSCAIAKKLQQQHCIITLDQAIYATALEVTWKKGTEFQHVVLRLGAFPLASAFLAVMGQCFGDAGLQDLLAECDVVGSSAAISVFKGKHYICALRAHKTAFEALAHF